MCSQEYLVITCIKQWPNFIVDEAGHYLYSSWWIGSLKSRLANKTRLKFSCSSTSQFNVNCRLSHPMWSHTFHMDNEWAYFWTQEMGWNNLYCYCHCFRYNIQTIFILYSKNKKGIFDLNFFYCNVWCTHRFRQPSASSTNPD